MRIFKCCFSADAGRQEVSQHEVTSPPSGLGTVLSAPLEADNIVSTTVHYKAPYLKFRELCSEKEWQDSNFSNSKDASGGLECALSLQAKLCAAGRTNQFREARAGFLVDIVQKHLGASAARLYIMASGYSNDGAARVMEGPLVQLACALLRGTAAGARNCNAQQGQDCFTQSEYLCPKHEPVGSSSVLLRQAMVSKVSVVLKCPARQEPPVDVDSNTPPPLSGQSRVYANPAAGVSVGVKSTHMGPAAPAVAGAHSNSSGYSSSAVHAELDTAAAAAAKCDTQCCPDLDLMETDALPGSAMVFAAIPLVYGMATLGVLWLAVPIPEEDTPNGGSPTYQLQTGTSTLITGSDLGCASPPIPPLPPTLLQQQQEACNISRGIGATTRPATNGSSLSLAASNAPAALLSNPAALEHVALSVAMHLAGGCADVAYLCRLGQALRGLAESATLAELVLELCNSLAQHVRQQFYVDVTAHAALVPAAESRVAFMLRSERVEGAASVRAARQQLTQSRLRMSSVASVPSGTNLLNLSVVAEANRSRSVTLTAHQMANNSRRGNGAAPTIAAANASTNSKPQQEHQLQRAYTNTTGSGDNVNAGAPRACSLSALRPSVPRDVFMLESSVMRSDGSFGLLSSCQAGPGGTAGVGFPPPALSARAFRLSNTLLQAMLHAAQVQQQRSGGDVVSGVVSGQGGRFLIGADRRKLVPNSFDDSTCAAASAGVPTSNGGVLAGVCVRDCARHVQDERQPSRDVCMLMMSAGDGTRFAAGTPAGLSSSVRGGGAVLNSEPATAVSAPGGNSGGGAQSLVLLGIETGDGAVLAVYLAFPTPAPIQLLDAVREGCNALLREHLATIVRHRLRCADLAAEWETLRAGVPGSYLSVSRCSIVPPELSSAGAAMSCIQSPLSQPSARRAAPLLMMSAGNNAIAITTTEDGGFLQGALSSCRGIASPQGRGVLGSVPGTAPVIVAGSEASLVSLAPGMGHGGGQMGAPQSASNISANGHASLTSGVMGGAMGSGPMGRSRKPSLTHGGMEDAGLTLGGPAWLQRSRRSASAVPMALAPARSTSSRGLFMRMGSLKHAAGGGGGATGGLLPQPPAGPIRSPINSGCFAGRFECTNSPVGPLTAEADDEEHGGWVESMAPGTGAAGGGLAAAGMLTVHDLDETYESWGMRAHMGALVDCILSTTLRSSGAHLRMDDGGAGRAEMVAARVTEGLDELQLSAVLGQGASGVVLKGMLGCTPVAVKIMEMPDADASVRDGANMSLHPSGDRGGQTYMHSSDDDTAICAGEGGGEGSQPNLGTGSGRATAEPRDVRARRALLRNAMEVALMRSISHVNIVQAFGVYDNVIMERHEGRQGIISLRRINQKDANDQKVPDAMNPGTMRSSPICTAIVLELCDRGSLADVLHNRSFPALPLPPPHPSASPAATAGAAMQFARYWKGVFMTLLEIALALRHLHSRRLVHRDLKPGNILLKSSPGDPRGWTCKLADFGFALVLDQLDQPSLEETSPIAAPAGGNGVGGAGGHCSSSSSSHQLVSPILPQAISNPPSAGTGTGIAAGNVGPRDWYTIQQHIGGTVTHMAPEAFKKGSRIDASVDVFSFGIVMWELVCSRGHRPHKDLALDAINNAVVNGARPIFPPGDHVPLSYRQLARSCWSGDPRLRPTAAELVTIIKGLLESTRA